MVGWKGRWPHPSSSACNVFLPPFLWQVECPANPAAVCVARVPCTMSHPCRKVFCRVKPRVPVVLPFALRPKVAEKRVF